MRCFIVRYRHEGRWRFVRDISDFRKAALFTSLRSAWLCARNHPESEVLSLEDESICLLNSIS